jgi:ParB-like chromosome segregation protein Spo0J
MTENNTNQQQNKAPLREMAVHKVAKLFPTLPEKELKELREDIKANGIKVPILVNKAEDTILDGRNRWKIAHELKLTKDQVPMEKFKGADEEIPSEILSRNIFRRHLTDDQRISLLAKVLAPKLEEEAEAGQAATRFGAKSTRETEPISNSFPPGKVAQQLAAKGKVSEHKARQSLKALRAGEIDDVITGKQSLKQAADKAPTKKRTPKKPPALEDDVVTRFHRWIKYWDITLHRRIKELLREYLAPKSAAK